MKTRANWLLPAALLTLSAVPLGVGAIRVAELAGGAGITPENARRKRRARRPRQPRRRMVPHSPL